ncbi:hypothetical protein DH2020_020218 [Rehmannia glutinosa]|uniref:O-methyltransferase C-terminal domain-containing protein n=1 Tax=Rehmannia glutinosa TaxID=99300 RepID=A0ABR0WH04_REHGL
MEFSKSSTRILYRNFSTRKRPFSRLLTRDNLGTFVLVQAGPPGPRFRLTAQDLKAGKGSGVEVAPEESKIWSMEFKTYGKMFQEFLASHAKVATSAVIENCPESFQELGVWWMLVAMREQLLEWINFDLPHVVSGAPILDRVEHVGGNMFESVPKADAVMLMWILHDWSDELCIDILKKCKEAIGKSGKVIIVEAVIDDDEEGNRDEYTGARLAMDMAIMGSTVNGKQRTAKEWAQLLHAAGFGSHIIKHMKAIESAIEAYP